MPFLRFLALASALALGLPLCGLADTGERVSLNGVEIYYEVHGAGEPLLLLHGGLGHGGAWQSQIAPFAERFRVIVMDSRGHGRSSFDRPPITYAQMARDVVALLDHLGIERTDVVGWSDGGIIGLELGIHHPRRVRRIVAYGANYDPSGVRSDAGENPRFVAFIEQAAADYRARAPEPQRWDEFYQAIGAMWQREPTYHEDDLAAIEAPVLVLAGAEEEAIHIDHVERTAALIPKARLVLLSGTGHFAHLERPRAFNRVVLEFLE